MVRVVLPIGAGALTGGFVTLMLSGMKPVWSVLLPLGLLICLPTLVVRDVKLYWLVVFLFLLQFDLKRSLADGLKIRETLAIDYEIANFVPQVRASDLALLVLLIFWLHQLAVRRQRLYFPKISWLPLAFVGWAGLSLFYAPVAYLSAVEWVQQCKFFLIYLYCANNIDSKRVLKGICLVLVATLLVQGTVSIVRYRVQHFEAFFGDTFGRDPVGDFEQLFWDPAVGGVRRSLGTVSSPEMFLLLVPLALMLSCRNPAFSSRWPFFLAFTVGTTGLYLTGSRSALLGFIVILVLFYYIGLRRGYLSREIGSALLVMALISGIVVAPKLYSFMATRGEAVDVRFEQYRTALSMVRKNPVLGVGLNNGTGAAKDYADHSSSSTDPTRHSAGMPIHSFYLFLLAEVGIIGSILYLSFFIFAVRHALRLSRSARDPLTSFFSTGVLLGLSGLATSIVTNTLSEDAIQTLLWLYAGAVVALGRIETEDGRP